MPQPDVLYLVYREGLSAVFHTRVAQPQGDLHNEGYKTHLAVFAPLGELVRPSLRKKWAYQKEELEQVFQGRLNLLPSPPSRLPQAWKEEHLLHWWSKLHVSGKPIVIHCRGPRAAYLGLTLRARYPRSNVLFDMRGLTSAELLFRKGFTSVQEAPSSVRSGVVESMALEKTASRESDAMICVSEAMKSFVSNAFETEAEKINVVPNYVFQSNYEKGIQRRDQTRKELGLKDRFVVTYSGSIKRRQNPGSTLKLFSMIKRIRPNAHFLVLTPNVERIKAYVTDSDISMNEVTIKSVAPTEVPRYLAAGDLGFITMGMMIPPFVAHQVSSPVKFAEYLAAGMPVIISSNISDFSSLTKRHNLGIVARPGQSDASLFDYIQSFLAEYASEPELIRSRCIRIAREKLSWAKHKPKVAAIYDNLLA